MRKTFLILALCFLFVLQAQAAVPKLLTYQGILKNGSGSYLTGTYSMTFRVYSAATGGSVLWTETQSSVSTSSGKFIVQLGSVTALNLDFNSDYWLSMQVGADPEMSSRTRLTSSGYDIRSDYENNGFTQAQHDALSHENIPAVKEDTINLAKTNFKVDAYTMASANSMADLIVDTFNDTSGIHSSSANYTWRASPDFDVTLAPTGGGVATSNALFETWKGILSTGEMESYNGLGQRFQIASAVMIDKATFKWVRIGNPSGNVRMRLYSISAGVPSTLLAESSNIAVASAPTSWAEITASFAPVALSTSTDYFICVENIDGSGDASNRVNIALSNGDAFTSGPMIYKTNDGNWSVIAAGSGDIYFKVYQQVTYPGTATVISNAFTTASTPTEAIVVADEALGTGSITYYVSRDNGTTWTACTKETVTSINSQPSGTQLKWKAVITGNAELNAIAVAV